MSKWHDDKWQKAAEAKANETGAAIQLIFDEIPKGQQKQLMKNPEIKEVLDRYGVVYET